MRFFETIGRRPLFSIVMIAILAVLLPLLAVVQYRWIGQVSEAERERFQYNLDLATERFGQDLFREFYRILFSFRLLPAGESLADHLARISQE